MGFPGSMPVLEHGDLKMFQSIAIQNYVFSIAPCYAGLTPAQRAVDDMWMCSFEDMCQTIAPPIFKAGEGAQEAQ